MAIKKYHILLLSLCILLGGCIEPFDIPVRNEDVGFLVVNGFVNTNDHSATVTLSRAIPLSSSSDFPRETNAAVSVEEEGGAHYELIHEQNGTYHLKSADFTTGKRYRLRIKTASNKVYLSAFITTRRAPTIDSLTWSATPDGVTIKLDTEDPEKQTKYYRWEYSETWKYEAAFSSEYVLTNGAVSARREQDQVKICYATEQSSQIITGSTANFSSDKFVDQEVAFLPFLSPKIRYRYSILVKQFALSKEAYDYWQQLSINTESLGGLFDPQPSQLRGNIKRTDDLDEPVIGYFDGGAVSEKRIFIDYLELPEYLQIIPITGECTQELIPLDSVHALGNFHLLTHSVHWGIILVGYNYTTLDCADCRRQGGTTETPSFW
jgi:hypothetical protein